MTRLYITPFDRNSLQPNQLFPFVRPFLNRTTLEWTSNSQVLERMGCADLNIEISASIEGVDAVLISEPLYSHSDFKRYRELEEINQICSRNNIHACAFISGDYGKVHPEFSNIVYYRGGGFKSQLCHCQNALFPLLSDQLTQLFHRNDIVPREKKAKPVVGFCGHASFSIPKFFYERAMLTQINAKRAFVGDFKFEPLFSSAFERAQLLDTISKSPEIDTNFILRHRYRAGAATEAERSRTTVEYFNNMINSDYVLCLRGSGNFSVRLYETLMMGRIPIFVNTDCILPLDEEIDWKEHVVWVEWQERKQIASLITAFHNKLTQSEFVRMQRTNRELWREKLTLGYFLRRFIERQSARTATIGQVCGRATCRCAS
jgi:hypothetical protein